MSHSCVSNARYAVLSFIFISVNPEDFSVVLQARIFWKVKKSQSAMYPLYMDYLKENLILPMGGILTVAVQGVLM